MAWYDWAAPAGAVAGFAGGELGGQLSNAIDAPRRWLWENVGQALGGSGTTSGSSLLAELFGADPENMGTQLGGSILESILDPMNLLGAGILGKAGSLIGGAGRNLASRAASRQAIASELGALNKMRSTAAGFIPSASAAEEAALVAAGRPRMLENVGMPSHAGTTYSDAVMRELPDIADIGNRGTMRTYGRMSPELSQAIDQMGIGYPTSAGTFVYQKPSFARGSGGVMQPSGDMPTGSQVRSWTGVPVEPAGLEQLIAGARFQAPQPLHGSMPLPTLAEQFEQLRPPRGAPSMYAQMPGAMIDTPGGTSHLLDMPLGEGLGAANARVAELRRALMGITGDEGLSQLERLLARTPLGNY